MLLLHGLVGRGATWAGCWPWLARWGRVLTWDAPGHRGADVADPGPWTTERFVDELAADLRAAGVGPAVVVGHSMGGLHAWCLAARHPDLVRALVVEDMAPDFRGRTAGDWAALLAAWPVPFADDAAVRGFFGDVAGEYFLAALDHRPGGRVPHGRPADWVATAEHWGTRAHWDEWDAVAVPALLVEAGAGVTPPGQVAEMARRAGCAHVVAEHAGHLVHDEDPAFFRGAVEAFLAGLDGPAAGPSDQRGPSGQPPSPARQ